MATVYMSNPYLVKYWMRPILPFFNVSDATISYLSVHDRLLYMARNAAQIQEIISKIPVLTASGIGNGYHGARLHYGTT